MIVKISDLLKIYEQELKSNVKNKKKIFLFEKNKMEYVSDIKRVLENNLYTGEKYHIFLIFKPKIRVVMSQSIYDKLINHYVTRYILIPKLSKYLNNRNCATRNGVGSSYALDLLIKDIKYYKRKQNEFYFLKLDLSKYFYQIDHEVLLNLIKEDLTIVEYKLIEVILNSTNRKYINKVIDGLEETFNIELPKYEENKGLPIGNMTSQFLAILYLSKLQHFIRHDLHLRFVNYMDDYIIVHENKEYLKECLKIIEEKLNREYKLKINKKKTVIVNAKDGINFLGYHFKVINKKLIIHLSKASKSNIKKGLKRTKNKKITFKQMFSSIETYKHSYKLENKCLIENIIEFYFQG